MNMDGDAEYVKEVKQPATPAQDEKDLEEEVKPVPRLGNYRRLENDMSALRTGKLCGFLEVRLPRGSYEVLNPALGLVVLHLDLKYADEWRPMTILMNSSYPLRSPLVFYQTTTFHPGHGPARMDHTFSWGAQWTPAYRLEVALVDMVLCWQEEEAARAKAAAAKLRPPEPALPSVPE